jgi:hypothetical protein
VKKQSSYYSPLSEGPFFPSPVQSEWSWTQTKEQKAKKTRAHRHTPRPKGVKRSSNGSPPQEEDLIEELRVKQGNTEEWFTRLTDEQRFVTHYIMTVLKTSVAMRSNQYRDDAFSDAFSQDEGMGLKRQKLTQLFHTYGINFEQDVRPVFIDAQHDFYTVWCATKAIKDVIQDHQKRMKKYSQAMNMVTSEDAPFAPSWKKRGLWMQTKLSGSYVENLMLKTMQQQLGQGKTLLDPTVDKSPHLHPIWDDTVVKLYDVIKPRVSKYRATRLIHELFQTFNIIKGPCSANSFHRRVLRLLQAVHR